MDQRPFLPRELPPALASLTAHGLTFWEALRVTRAGNVFTTHSPVSAAFDTFSPAQELVHGVDVWINTPRRPLEACGTSGMKVLVNGGLNLSVLDGWWAEAYEPGVGWAIGDATDRSDAGDAESLFELLEEHVVPTFYGAPERLPMTTTGTVSGTTRGYLFSVKTTVRRAPDCYTARVVPAAPATLLPLELPLVAWRT